MAIFSKPFNLYYCDNANGDNPVLIGPYNLRMHLLYGEIATGTFYDETFTMYEGSIEEPSLMGSILKYSESYPNAVIQAKKIFPTSYYLPLDVDDSKYLMVNDNSSGFYAISISAIENGTPRWALYDNNGSVLVTNILARYIGLPNINNHVVYAVLYNAETNEIPIRTLPLIGTTTSAGNRTTITTGGSEYLANNAILWLESLSGTKTGTTYTCTVVNGSGSGEYAENATVEITADEPEEGYEFDTWEANHSLTFVQGSYTSAHALFVMPASAVTITALYKQKSDPFGPGGTSEPGGGGGTFDDTSDNIDDSSLPSLSAADTGFTTIYNPTLAQLQSLADYMWTSDSFLETIVNHAKQLLENPINAVIALNIVPCPVPDGGSQEVKVLFVPTGVTMTKAANQFVDVDCGTVRLDEYYGSAMDYSPLTEITCYLPYIGQVTLDTDEVMGNTLQVKYRIDIVTGMCVAKIFVSGNLLYQFSGHCAINTPITSADFSSYIGAIIQAAKLVGGAIAAGAGGAAAMATTDVPEATTTPALQPSPNAQPIAGMPEATESTPSKFGEVAKKTVMNTVDAVMGSKTVIEHSGGFSGNSGYLAVRRPYLIIKRPRMCNPNEYGAYNGYPSMMYLNLGSCSGYTEVQEIQLTGLPATNPELSEIAQLLKAGVIL